MHYRPRRTLGLLIGGSLTAWAAVITVALLAMALRSDLGLRSSLAYLGAAFGLLLAATFAYWTYALSTLAYSLDRNGLIITWGPTQQVIPLGAIERLVPATAVGASPRVRGVTWWGHHVGRATIERIGPVLFYSTHQSPEQVLYVMTTERNYALSVDDPAAFADEVVRRQALGPTAELSHHVRRSGIGALALREDRTALGLIGAAVALGALVWLQVAVRYNSLPESFELHFPPSNVPPLPELVARSAIFELPQTAALMLLGGLALGALLHRWERVAGYLVFGTAAVVQAMFIVATAIAIHSA